MRETSGGGRRAALGGSLGLGPLAGILLLAGCTVGPKYAKPPAPAPAAYKETGNWTAAQPMDQAPRGRWWELFGDGQLDALEDKVDVSNQNLKQAQDQYLEARDLVHSFRAGYYPVATGGLAASRSHTSNNHAPRGVSNGATFNDYLLPVDASYEPDLWGQVRRSVEESRAAAQASAAALASVNLSLHAELALDYFQLRGLDTQEKLLQSTVADDQRARELAESRYKGGLATAVDVAQAETQLQTTRAQATDVEIERAAFEHAVAVLTGVPPAGFSLAATPLQTPPPPIPPGLPSQLLERRPDIAGAERQMDAANAQIGVAMSAYYPLVNLTGASGFESGALGTFVSGPSGLWSAGAAALDTVFEGGRRRAATAQARAAYDQAVANYRQTVLAAFQQVEDNLAAQRVLAAEAKTQEAAVAAAQRSLALSLVRYKGGVTSYLEVVTAQSAALGDERGAADILTRRMVAAVLLVKALGGGWDASQLPAAASLR
ncbi:MAG TPA: efflux transporter outer membrane subunit [Candidatus Acidoferrales bacterium]|nr:efflux transporter outer membrane subunit [Candidatus Acidoferrales bacterium]